MNARTLSPVRTVSMTLPVDLVADLDATLEPGQSRSGLVAWLIRQHLGGETCDR